MRLHKELNQNEHQNYLWQTAQINSAVSWTSLNVLLVLKKDSDLISRLHPCLHGVCFFCLRLQ